VGISLNNWWALFILIPAIGSLWTAWTIYQKNDRKFTAASTGPLIGGIALLMVTAIFLFNLDWGRVWPVFLIIAGAAVLLGVVRRPR
jgi:UDP-N-acetylmuramyl pentapeptide phosphotransferase/UDP-N-acetylglucosamine-1-phosphate transferase